MQFETLTDKLTTYVASIFYPLTLAVLAFLTWLLPSFGPWFPAILFGVLSFLPIITKDGKGYLPVILFMILMSNKDISFDTIPIYLYLLASAELVSLILFIILRKPNYQKNYIFYILLCIFFIALISYLHDSIKDGFTGETGIFYLLSLFVISVLYLLLSIIIGKGESLQYLCKTVIFFAFIICAQIFVYGLKNQFKIDAASFTLGWSYTIQTASTLLCLSLPFFGILMSKKRLLWAIGIIPVFIAILFLSADSGLLALIIFFIPITLLVLRNTGKNYPYFALLTLVLLIAVFGVLMGVSKTFNERVITAVSTLNIFNEPAEWRNTLFHTSVENFLAAPVLGPSLNALILDNGQMLLSSNTILTTMSIGGSFALIAYFLLEVRIYYVCLKKDTEDKWLFLVFLLMVEIIGLIDNTIYNVAILLFYLIMFTGYQMSNRPEDVVIHEDFYLYYNQERIDNCR